MPDHNTIPPLDLNNQTPLLLLQSLLGSPKLKSPFSFKPPLLEKKDPITALMSPTSILDNKPPLKRYTDTTETRLDIVGTCKNSLQARLDTKGISVALIEDEEDTKIPSPRPCNRMVLAKTRDRIESAESRTKTNFSSSDCESTESPVKRCLSIREMELSEDYTRVISHGPNPKTTHIYQNCIVGNSSCVPDDSNYALKNFLSFCYTCHKTLEEKKDIYIYRGEKAFCSQECRYKEMLIDEVRKLDSED